MSISKLNIRSFFELSSKIPILDVRSPSEFAHAHIPGAISLPLFNDEERKEIGTAYKQQSRETAIKIGLKAFGPKLLSLVEAVEQLPPLNENRQVRLHCWRGGMRSGAVAWLLDLYGYKVHLLAGGYKSYRHHVLDLLSRNYKLKVLGGCTGGNKTGLLHAMRKEGHRVIDLEGLAGHKGSAFGNILQIPQPSQEHFENLLAEELQELSSSDSPIWAEAESQRIGQINLPLHFFNQMRAAPLLFLDVPFEARLKHILEGYGSYDKDKMINAIIRIKKKLGGLETKNAINALVEDDPETCFRVLLLYYDKLYLKSLKGNENPQRTVETISSSTTDAGENLKKVLAQNYV